MSVIVITGASSGIGRAAALELAKQGHEVVAVGRDPERTAEVAARAGGSSILADLSSLAGTRALADELAKLPRIDVLANNAGGILRGPRELSPDGFERMLQLNVLAPFVLTELLAPRIREHGGRVLFTGSVAHRFGSIRLDDLGWEQRRWLDGWPQYGAVKRANLMLARETPKRLGVDAYSFHPGGVATGFGGFQGFAAAVSERVMLTPEQGAAPLVYLAGTREVAAPVGTYFDRMRPGGRTAAQVRDDAECAALWDALAELLASAPDAQAGPKLSPR